MYFLLVCFFQVLIYLERASAGLPRLKRSVSEPQIYRSYYEQHDFLPPVQSPNTPKTNAAANFSFFTAYSWNEHL